MSKLVPLFNRYLFFIDGRCCSPSFKYLLSISSNFRCPYEWANNNYRNYATNNEEKHKSLAVKPKGDVGSPVTLKTVKETTKTVSYMGVILAGVGVTAVMFYTIFSELFSSKSPNSVYTKTVDRCSLEPKVIQALGEPIKGFGEETRRGRRRHVSHLLYEREGRKYLRMKFYIQGNLKKATVHLEMQENDKGDYEYRYLLVQVNDYPGETIILEDNRFDVPNSSEKPYDLQLV